MLPILLQAKVKYKSKSPKLRGASLLQNNNSVLNYNKSYDISTIKLYQNKTIINKYMQIQQIMNSVDNNLSNNQHQQQKFRDKIKFKIFVLDQPRMNSSDLELIEILYQEITHQSQYLCSIDSLTRQKMIQLSIRNFKNLKSHMHALLLPYQDQNIFKHKGLLQFDIYNKSIDYNLNTEMYQKMNICLEKIKLSIESIFSDNGYFFRYILFLKYQINFPNKFILYLREEQWVDSCIKYFNTALRYLFFV